MLRTLAYLELINAHFYLKSSLIHVPASTTTMTPALTLTSTVTPAVVDVANQTRLEDLKKVNSSSRPTHILHRTPWRPPVARSAHGIYVELEDGRTIIDGVGGAAVACIGNGHPAVVQAIKDQVEKMSCACSFKYARGFHPDCLNALMQTYTTCSFRTSQRRNLRIT